MEFVGHEDAGLAQELGGKWKRDLQILEVISEVSGIALAPLSVASVVGWKLQCPRTILGLQNAVRIVKLLLCFIHLLENDVFVLQMGISLA